MEKKDMKANLKQRQDTIRSRRQKRKVARQARLRRQILRYFSLAIIVGLTVSCFIFLPWTIKDIDHDVVVRGNIVTTDKQVKDVLRNSLSVPLYKLNPKELEKQICQLQSVQYAFVRRYLLPHPYLTVEIMEEFPWASYADTPEAPVSGVIAQTGRFISTAKFPSVIQPAFKLIGPKATRLHEADVKEWYAWVSYIADQTDESVKYVDLRQADCVWVATDNLLLKLGETDQALTKRLARLASVLPSLGSIHQSIEYIDLSLDSNVPVKVGKTINKDKNKNSEH